MGKILEIRDLNFSFDRCSENSLSNINLEIEEGELVFLTGPSGSGKSTLLNIIVGAIPEVIEGKLSGQLILDGKENLKSYERALIIGNVFQNPRSQFFTTNTTAEMVFPLENYGYSKEDMEKILCELTRQHRLDALMDRDVFSLSSGERQKLALVSSLVLDPKLLIFDEPSANLDYGNVMALKKELIKLNGQGKSILVADHRCFYLMDIIDKVLYMENGTLMELSPKEYMEHLPKRQWRLLDEEKIQGNWNTPLKHVEVVRDELGEATKKDSLDKLGEPLLAANALSYPPILKNISLSFYRKEIVIIVGVNGAGKTTLARVIAGCIKAKEGSLSREAEAFYVMQDAEFQLFAHSCDAELKISSKDEKANLLSLKKLGLLKKINSHPQELSGGEKQRLQLAIACTIDRDIIILDEPTSGLDIDSMDKLVALIQDLAENKAIVIISHDYEFIRKIGQRVIYMDEGKIKDDFYLIDDGIAKLNKIFKEMEALYEKSFED